MITRTFYKYARSVAELLADDDRNMATLQYTQSPDYKSVRDRILDNPEYIKASRRADLVSDNLKYHARPRLHNRVDLDFAKLDNYNIFTEPQKGNLDKYIFPGTDIPDVNDAKLRKEYLDTKRMFRAFGKYDAYAEKHPFKDTAAGKKLYAPLLVNPEDAIATSKFESGEAGYYSKLRKKFVNEADAIPDAEFMKNYEKDYNTWKQQSEALANKYRGQLTDMDYLINNNRLVKKRDALYNSLKAQYQKEEDDAIAAIANKRSAKREEEAAARKAEREAARKAEEKAIQQRTTEKTIQREVERQVNNAVAKAGNGTAASTSAAVSPVSRASRYGIGAAGLGLGALGGLGLYYLSRRNKDR